MHLFRINFVMINIEKSETIMLDCNMKLSSYFEYSEAIALF